MVHYEFLFRRDGRIRQKDGPAGHDNRAAVEALLGVLAPDEEALFGVATDKGKGQPADPVPSCVDVLARFGIVQVQYGLDGGPILTIMDKSADRPLKIEKPA